MTVIALHDILILNLQTRRYNMSNIQIIKNESGKYSPEWFYNEAQKPEWIAFARTANTLHENFINHFGIEQLKSLSGKELLTWNYFWSDLGKIC